MIRRLTGRLLVALAAVLIGAQPLTAHAATSSGGLSIGPFIQEVDLAKGQKSASFEITLGNNSDYTLPMVGSIVDFGAADDHGGVDFLSTSDKLQHKYGLASWMSLDKTSLVLQPHSAQQIKVTIDNRDSLGPGGHYGAVIFQLDPSLMSTADQSKVNFVKAVSTLVLAKKLDGAKESVNYSSMTWNGAPFALPTSANIKFYNNGNVHSEPVGDLKITDTLGHVVSDDPVNQAHAIVLPGTQRIYPTSISNAPIQWIPGWATITLRYRPDDSTGPYQSVSERFFVVSPCSIAVIIVLLILIALAIRFRKQIAAFILRLRGYATDQIRGNK